MEVKIKPDTKNAICRALRSGEYRQGQEFWADDGSRCVGGVIDEDDHYRVEVEDSDHVRKVIWFRFAGFGSMEFKEGK